MDAAKCDDIEPSLKMNTTDDVVAWLEDIGLGEYAEAFRKNDVNREVLCTLTPEEMRDDLGVVNLRHRRELIEEISKLVGVHTEVQSLPEHGRILDHLSNVRTFHSWIRVGVQLLGFSLVALRLFPVWRSNKALVVGISIYLSIAGLFSICYGLVRYFMVIRWIEESGTKSPKYNPDVVGVLVTLCLVLIASILAIVLILWHE